MVHESNPWTIAILNFDFASLLGLVSTHTLINKIQILMPMFTIPKNFDIKHSNAATPTEFKWNKRPMELATSNEHRKSRLRNTVFLPRNTSSGGYLLCMLLGCSLTLHGSLSCSALRSLVVILF